ncbi:AraC family transcriptional regulator [Nordella sp. HKS 07]|uniref:helix-turn-helix domain-containing protein n=1 Tax=Nordella sp. HKS 07 TaxID=2712222 RepID=UPI0013E18026|nr:AraC family transcriptional regulator [Nordella sp. HKS 07]QIG49109.1 AraC family transcriptional regulator [Nordella sp. HKS 07]
MGSTEDGTGADRPEDSIPLVRTSALLSFVGFLERIGAPVEKRLADVKLPYHALSEPESLIPLNQALLFLDRIARSEGLKDLGVLVGRATHVPELGAFGRLVLQSLTLFDALTRISQIIHLYNSAQFIWVDSWNGKARVCAAYGPNVGPGREYGEQYTLMLLIDCIRFAAGPAWTPSEIHLAGTLWDSLAGHGHAFDGIPVRRQQVSAIVFERALLSAPIERARLARMEAGQREYDALVSTAPSLDFPDSVGQLVRMFLKDGHYHINWIAAAAGISVRTLQRRLAERGVDYSALVEGARFDIAVHLLKDHGRKLIDIAFDLGYADAASFTRAFRRWTGVTPSEFRHLHAAA